MQKSIEDEIYKQIYNFHRLVKVKEDAERQERADINTDSSKKNKLREPLDISEKVLVLAARLKKKNVLWFLYKSATQNKWLLNKDKIFIIIKRILYDNYHYYWISKEGEEKIKNRRYIRQELFALNNHFM